MMKIVFILLSVVFFCNVTHGFKVLGILPMASKSHFAIGNSIAQTLYDAGHELTLITPYPSNKVKQNYREISYGDLVEKMEADKGEIKSKSLI